MIHVKYLKRFFCGSFLASFLYSAVCLVFLSGCASSYDKFACRYNIDDQIAGLNLQNHFKSMAKDLCLDICKPGECPDTTVLVTDFVDVQSLVPKKSGMIMGELMRSNINKVCGYKIVQVEFSNLFKLSEGGLITLSRNPADLQQSEYSVKNCVVGTYSVSHNKLYLFVRIINTTTGKIVKMTSRVADLSCD